MDRVVIEGAERLDERYLRNQLRTSAGRPLDYAVVRGDVRRLERLGEFSSVSSEVLLLPGGELAVLFAVEEAPIVEDIVVVGNRQVADEDIARVVNQVVSLISGVPIDEYRIGQAQAAIENLYRDRGFYQVEVRVDEEELEENGIVLFRVREGEQTQITGIRFEGNSAFSDRRLRGQIETSERFLFINAPIDDELLEQDVASLILFYRNAGYLDVRAARRVTLAPNSREAVITFLIEEGPRYTLRRVFVTNAEDLTVLSAEQVRGLIPLKPGAWYEADVAEGAEESVRDALRQLGYVDARVRRREIRAIDAPEIDMGLTIEEGPRYRTGLVRIIGNTLTQQKVIRRRVDIRPESWLDATAIERSELSLKASGLFEVRDPRREPRILIQPPDPENPGYRDVLVEVAETNTGSFSFGAAVSSDAGVVGAVQLTQRNFDIADVPDSFGEFLSGRAFRGAGQTFDLLIQPGTEVSTYSVSFTEPAFLDSDYGFTTAGFFRAREFRDYDEQRFGGRFRVGRRFGTRWNGGLIFRAENIALEDIDESAPVDVFAVEDPSTLTSVGVALNRTTVDNRFRPTKGTRTELTAERVGLLGGDYEFTRLFAEHTAFLTIDRDAFDRATVLSIGLRGGLIPESGESPVFERFYLGGRSLRGFEFRGVGPVGIRNDTGLPGDDKVGGDFLFFAGAEIEKPLWQETLAGVVFLDTGTLANDVEFDEYRVAAGVGVRLYLPQFSQAPLAFDFGFPLVKEDTDETQVFSFSIDLPF